MSSNNIHNEWLSLVEISGPFFAPPVLNEAFPQGLDLLDPAKRKRLRQTYEEWREALDSEDPDFEKLHQAWIKEVISNCLGFDEDGRGTHLKFGAAMPPTLVVQIPEQGVTLAPEYVLVDEQHDNKPLLLIQSYASGVDLQAAMSIDGWSATPADRMVQLCRLTGCRLGLVTDGERWMLIDAPVGAVTTFASWYARLWIQEPITLQAFVHLLGIRRFFVAAGEQIPALIDKSLQHQDEVTTALGEQVQRAVEVLIQSLDRADKDRDRELLKDVTPAELYEAGLTVMMRLVFLLSAEERGLLLMGDECYEENYAISSLRMQLRSESEEILERRWDAWSRLLSVFRAVYGGIDHENMRLPALGGSLFDPDRFPFLEGRAKGSNWHKEPAKPLPIDNRTVLLLLESIQQYQGVGLSYKALDVEQIGYVYEGLLDRGVTRSKVMMVELNATKSAKSPWISFDELIGSRAIGEDKLILLIKEKTGQSVNRIRADLSRHADESLSEKLFTACQGDRNLHLEVLPFANLIKLDPWGYPLIYPAGSLIIMTGSDRRTTGAHYTPQSLTEVLVNKALGKVVYEKSDNASDGNNLILKSPTDLLELKICDPAMGSGAFLVQACRFLSEKLVESWGVQEKLGNEVQVDGLIVPNGESHELMPKDAPLRMLMAKRLIAERCLYGVDLNPMAVELAKLSIWLLTLSKNLPFGFLDHNLRSGNSLLGVISLNQITELNLNSNEANQFHLFGRGIQESVDKAIAIREELRKLPIRKISDIKAMSDLDGRARGEVKTSEAIANALISEFYLAGKRRAGLDRALIALAIEVENVVYGDTGALEKLSSKTETLFRSDPRASDMVVNPFNWPLEFPEIFQEGNPGFSAIITNPPFAEGDSIPPLLMEYFKKNYLVATGGDINAPSTTAKTNLLTLFVERCFEITKIGGAVSFVAPKPFLRNERYWSARRYMLEQSSISIIFNLPSNLFRSASVETCALVTVKVQNPTHDEIFTIINTEMPEKSFESSCSVAWGDEYFVLRIESSGIEDLILKEISKDSIELSEYFEVRVGVNAGRKDFRQHFLGKRQGDLFFPLVNLANDSTFGHSLADPELFDSEVHKKTINGRDFTSFSLINWDGVYMRYAERYAYVEDFFVSGTRWSAQLREKTHYDREIKVVSRQTANTLIATIDTQQYFPLDTVHVHYPKPEAAENGYNCFVLTALLNSNVLRFYYRVKSEEVGSVFPQVHVSKLKTLPIPKNINKYDADKLTDLTKSIIGSEATDHVISELNSLIYKLYKLDKNTISGIEKAFEEDGDKVNEI